MEKWGDFEYNDLNMIDLVKTHLNHPWGPPGWFDALNSVLVVIFGHFWHAWKWPISPKITIFRHVGNDQIWPPVPSSMHQTIQGDPRDGWDELKPDPSYLSHFPPWYSKSGHFPIELPIKNKKCLQNWEYGSIIRKIILWAHFTITHVVFWDTLI